MYQTGQKVVAINTDFAPWVHDLYRQLPVKHKIYTIRAVAAGRSNPNFVVNDDAKIIMTGAEFDILVLLAELHNPDDPHSSAKQELGFKGDRFAPLLVDDEEVFEHDMIPSGFQQEELVPVK